MATALAAHHELDAIAGRQHHHLAHAALTTRQEIGEPCFQRALQLNRAAGRAKHRSSKPQRWTDLFTVESETDAIGGDLSDPLLVDDPWDAVRVSSTETSPAPKELIHEPWSRYVRTTVATTSALSSAAPAFTPPVASEVVNHSGANELVPVDAAHGSLAALWGLVEAQNNTMAILVSQLEMTQTTIAKLCVPPRAAPAGGDSESGASVASLAQRLSELEHNMRSLANSLPSKVEVDQELQILSAQVKALSRNHASLTASLASSVEASLKLRLPQLLAPELTAHGKGLAALLKDMLAQQGAQLQEEISHTLHRCIAAQSREKELRATPHPFVDMGLYVSNISLDDTLPTAEHLRQSSPSPPSGGAAAPLERAHRPSGLATPTSTSSPSSSEWESDLAAAGNIRVVDA